MSLGKDSIQKRVAKPAEAPAAKKAPVKRTTGVKTAPKAAVITNISPETLKKLAGNKKDSVEKVKLGDNMPYYLL